ncbi:MAG: GNAT family N-acetyltransferase [Bdellovibrionales bacterium]|nr:GNAT family N-acetyltransferase [Bdellovibrionales bacterium]
MNLNKYELHQKPLSRGLLEDLKEVFFLTSSKKVFKSNDEKNKFYHRWLGIYLKHYPEETFYITFNDNLVAYLLACTDTQDFINNKVDFSHKLGLFTEMYTHYPCHLHMNCHPDHQRKGLGKILMQALFSELKRKNVQGVHLLTSPDMDNVYFYRKQGFDKEQTIFDGKTQFHFMGKSL